MKNLKCKILIVVSSLLLLGSCKQKEIILQQEEVISSSQDRSVINTITTASHPSIETGRSAAQCLWACGNCVTYAVCRSDNLNNFPLPLFDITNKCKLINKCRNAVSAGDIVIMNLINDAVGHVGYVVTVNHGNVLVSSGNYDGNGNCNVQTFRINDSRIIGFYDPSLEFVGGKNCDHYTNNNCPY